MKKSTKVLYAVLLIFSFTCASFAQTSNTSFVTQNTFKTDVDSFLDVNDWNTVKPANWFGFMDLSSSYFYGTGFAKDFKNFYLGAYYYGRMLSGIQNSTTTTDTTSGGTTTVDAEDISNKNSPYNKFYVLAGIGNWGIKAGCLLYNYDVYKSANDAVAGTESSSHVNSSKYIPRVSAGTTITTQNVVFKPWAGLEYTIKPQTSVYKTVTTADTIEANVYNPQNLLGVKLGTDIGFKPTETVGQNLNLEFDFSTGMNFDNTTFTCTDSASDATRTTYKDTYNCFTRFWPKYTIKLTPAERFKINVAASCLVDYSYDYTGHSDTKETVAGTSTTYYGQKGTYTAATSTYSRTNDQNDVTTNKISFAPMLQAGLQFAVVPDKFIWNSGIAIYPSNLDISFINTKTDIATPGETEKTNYTYNNDTVRTAWGDVLTYLGTGFIYYLTDKIQFDVSYNIYDFTGTSFHKIWNNSYFALSVSAKF